MANTPTGSSLSQFLTTLIINGLIFLVFITLFLILRPKQTIVYQPRTVLKTIPPEKRVEDLPKGPFNWIPYLLKKPDSYIIKNSGIDGYFFLRYLFIMALCFLVGCLITYPVLFSVNATGHGGQTGLDLLSYQNIKNKNRAYAHVFIGWIFFGMLLFVLNREIKYFVAFRQAALTSPLYSNKISSKTVLFTDVPEEYLSYNNFNTLFTGVKRVWLARQHDELDELVEDRSKLVKKYEGAGNSVIIKAIGNKIKGDKKGKKWEGEQDDFETFGVKRPTYRLKFLIGEKVDTLNYTRDKSSELNEKILENQNGLENFPLKSSVFVLFDTQQHAEIAYQTIIPKNEVPGPMSPRFIGISPSDVIWSNLNLTKNSRRSKAIITGIIIGVLIIFWAIPVAVVGAISNINFLTDKVHFLKFLDKLPSVLMGVVTALLPTILLSLLMTVLAMFLRYLAKVAGAPSNPLVEYHTQQSYFAFQVIQVFLVTTLASAATSVATKIIKDPSNAMTLLSENLPKSSNFYIAYMLLQGLSVSGGALLQVVGLILFHLFGKFLDKTPRQKWSRHNVLGSLKWGTIFPVYTNLAVIAITYSIITPLILIFTGLGFLLLYLAYMYNLTYVLNNNSDGRGIYYPRAIYQTYVGLYLGEVFMLALFITSKSWGPIALQGVMILFTALCQRFWTQRLYDPLLANLQFSEDDETNVQPTTAESDPEKNMRSQDVPSPSNTSEIDSPRQIRLNSDAEKESTLSESSTRVTNRSDSFKTVWYGRFISFGDISNSLPSDYNHPPKYPDNYENDAYNDPAITEKPPFVWLPHDDLGVSTKEIGLSEGKINVSDHGSHIGADTGGKVQWDEEGYPPGYEETIEQ